MGGGGEETAKPGGHRPCWEGDGRSRMSVGGLTWPCLQTEMLAEAEVLSTGPGEAFLTCHLSTGDTTNIHASQGGLPDV